MSAFYPGTDDRFRARLTPERECLIWTGFCDRQGYGKVVRKPIGAAPIFVHRHAWMLVNGPISPAVAIRQTCGRRACANVAHLRPTTDKVRGTHSPLRESAVVREVAAAIRERTHLAGQSMTDFAARAKAAAERTWSARVEGAEA